MTKNVILIIHSDFTKSENADQNSHYPTMTNKTTMVHFVYLSGCNKTARLRSSKTKSNNNKPTKTVTTTNNTHTKYELTCHLLILFSLLYVSVDLCFPSFLPFLA